MLRACDRRIDGASVDYMSLLSYIVIYSRSVSVELSDQLPISTIERWLRTRDPPTHRRPRAPQRAAGKGLFPTDSDTHILDRLNAIYKYRYVVVTVFLLVLLAVAVRTFTTTPMYRATTSVLIEDERAASVAGFNSATSSDYLPTRNRITRRSFVS